MKYSLFFIMLLAFLASAFASETEKKASQDPQTRITVITAVDEYQMVCANVEYVFSHNPSHTGRGTADGCVLAYSVQHAYQSQTGDGVVFRVGSLGYQDCHFNEIANTPGDARITLACADDN